MASGGGATTTSDLAQHQKDAHGLLLLGMDSSSALWLASAKYAYAADYDTNPSVLSFLINKGLTAAGGNPFEGVSGYDPDDDLTEAEARLDSVVSVIDNLSETGDFQSFLTTAQMSQDQIEHLDIDALFSSIIAQAITNALAGIASAFENAKTNGLDASAAMSSAAWTSADAIAKDAEDKALTSTDMITAKMFGTVDADSLALAESGETALRAQAETAMASIIGNIDPDLSIPVSSAVSSVSIHAVSIMQNAMATALQCVDEEMLSAVVSAFRRRQLRTHLRSVNRFAGGMSDINAVNSSAFIIGMALLESDFEQSVADFTANLEITLYKEGLARFVELFTNIVNEQLRLYGERFRDYLAAYQMSSNSYEHILLTKLPAYMQSYVGVLSTLMEAKLSTYKQDSSMQGATFAANLDGHLRLLTQALVSHFDSSVKSHISEQAMKADFVQNNMRLIEASHELRLGLLDNSIARELDMVKTRIVAKVDQYGRDLELDVKTSNWDMELFQSAGNVLSAVTGAVVQNAAKPSQAQSAIAGLVSGASAGGAAYRAATGAAAGSALGPVGMAVGAVGGILGGLAGALG